MNFESRLWNVASLFLPDKTEVLSKDDDIDPLLSPLEYEGVLVDEEEILETGFLARLSPLLSNDDEVTLLVEESDDNDDDEEEETGNDCLTEDPVDVEGIDFLVSEMLFPLLKPTEGNELLLSSGRDLLVGSALFLPALEVYFTMEGFSITPPVFFNLDGGTGFEDDTVLVVSFFTPKLESKLVLVLDSNLFLLEIVWGFSTASFAAFTVEPSIPFNPSNVVSNFRASKT